jgi:hypothetical protein
MAAATGHPPWTDLSDKTGKEGWDNTFNSWLPSLNDNFGVRAALVFYNDHDALNAEATPTAYFPHGPDGTVEFGRGLLSVYDYFHLCGWALSQERMLDRPMPGEPGESSSALPLRRQLGTDLARDSAALCKSASGVLAPIQPLLITAHEFGHILQYKMGMTPDGPWQMEPHADYMAGWYIGRYYSSRLTDESLGVFARPCSAWATIYSTILAIMERRHFEQLWSALDLVWQVWMQEGLLKRGA